MARIPQYKNNGHSGGPNTQDRYLRDSHYGRTTLAKLIPNTAHQIIHEAYGQPAVQRPVRCPLCGEPVRQIAGARGSDPLTGCCTAKKACLSRRKDYDDETIEFLGLIPRGKEDQHDQPR